MRTVQLRAGHYYHVYNRGINRQNIFFRPENWAFFVRRLRKYFVPELVEVIAYCLMPNHYHLLVHLLDDDFGNKVMQPFTISYTKAINKEQQRTGHLFEGPFQAVLVEDDAYLKNLSRYIHLNPVAAGLTRQPEDWMFSSYRDYVGLRDGAIPKSGIVLEQFGSAERYIEYVLTDHDPNSGLPDDYLLDE